MLQTSLSLLLFLFPLAYSPGPGNMFFAANGARFGFGATLPANLGYHAATWIVTAAIGFGFLAMINRFPQIFTFLKLGGSAYVLYIAWKIFKSGRLDGAADAQPATALDGVILLLLNPKAYVIIALMFTQFLDQSSASIARSVLLITTLFTLNNLLAFAIWAWLGDRIAGVFRAPQSAAKLNMSFAAILAIVAFWMLFS